MEFSNDTKHAESLKGQMLGQAAKQGNLSIRSETQTALRSSISSCFNDLKHENAWDSKNEQSQVPHGIKSLTAFKNITTIN